MRYSGCAAAALLLSLAGCVIPERDAPREALDQDTGTTVTAMGSALEFYSARPELGLQAASFAHLGAFEANRMGARRLLLWLSVVPGGGTESQARAANDPQTLVIVVDASRIQPALASRDARELGLGRVPFKRPAAWARDAFFDVTIADLRRIESSTTLELLITSAEGSEQRYEVWKPERESLRRFLDTLQGAGTR